MFFYYVSNIYNYLKQLKKKSQAVSNFFDQSVQDLSDFDEKSEDIFNPDFFHESQTQIIRSCSQLSTKSLTTPTFKFSISMRENWGL